MLVERLLIGVLMEVHDGLVELIQRLVDGLKAIVERNSLAVGYVLQRRQFLHSEVILLHRLHRYVDRQLNHVLLIRNFLHRSLAPGNRREAQLRVQRGAARALHNGVGFFRLAAGVSRLRHAGDNAHDGADHEESCGQSQKQRLLADSVSGDGSAPVAGI